MGEAWGDSDTALVEAHGIKGAFIGRITNCQTGDTLTVPAGRILADFFYDETTGGGVTVAISANEITITCTNNDEINFMVFVVK